MKSASHRTLLIACLLLAGAIFTIDLYTPRGIADAVSYVGVVVLTLWSNRRYHTWIAAIVGSLLTLLGLLFSPPGEVASIFVANRVLALIGIWVAAFVILRFKASEDNARKTRDSLNALFTHATEGIIISDASGKVVMVNPEAEKQFGYTPGELVGQSIDVLVPMRHAHKHAGNRASFYAHPHSRSMGENLELSGRRKDGGEFPVEISLSSYKLGNELFVVAFIINITERKKQQEALRRSHEELQQYAVTLKETNAELENFAYISSHDLQEPLRKIQSFGDRLVARDQDKLSEEGKDYLARMMNASARMQKLINDLLSFSRLTSRSQAYVPVNLAVVAKEVMSDMEVLIEKNHAKVEIGTLPELVAEPTQMRQLFQNLIGNAIKFKKDGATPHVSVSAENISVDGKRDFVLLQFADNGIGFDEKYHDKIFSIFQRLDGAKYEGSGIGLAICKKIALRHGGTITAKSKKGEGSVFSVMLPVSQSNN